MKQNRLTHERRGAHYWTPEEIKILKEFYRVEGGIGVGKRLGLTARKVSAKANELLLFYDPYAKYEVSDAI